MKVLSSSAMIASSSSSSCVFADDMLGCCCFLSARLVGRLANPRELVANLTPTLGEHARQEAGSKHRWTKALLRSQKDVPGPGYHSNLYALLLQREADRHRASLRSPRVVGLAQGSNTSVGAA